MFAEVSATAPHLHVDFLHAALALEGRLKELRHRLDEVEQVDGPCVHPEHQQRLRVGRLRAKKDKGGQSQPLTIKPGWNVLDTIEGRPLWAGGRGEGNKGLNIEYTR